MPSKPNYNFQRAERDRLKKAKKEERLQEKKEQSLRKTEPEGVPEPLSDTPTDPDQ